MNITKYSIIGSDISLVGAGRRWDIFKADKFVIRFSKRDEAFAEFKRLTKEAREICTERYESSKPAPEEEMVAEQFLNYFRDTEVRKQESYKIKKK